MSSQPPASLTKSVEETKASYVQFGASGLRVSTSTLGVMSFDHKDWLPWLIDDESQVEELPTGAFQCGVNTWDTANVYSNGVSEEAIGRVVKKHNMSRHKLVLLAKCFGTVGEEPGVVHMGNGKEVSQSKTTSIKAICRDGESSTPSMRA